MSKRLTKRVVDLTHPGSAYRFLWDSELKGFGLKVTPAGRKSFVAQHRNREDGRTRRLTIGSYGILTVEEARSEARRILGEAATGKDPASIRRLARGGDRFGPVFEQFLKHHVDAKRKKRTAEEYRRTAKLHLLPRWTDRNLIELNRSDVVKLHREMADAPYAANRSVALLSKFFNWCERKVSGLITRSLPSRGEVLRKSNASGSCLARNWPSSVPSLTRRQRQEVPCHGSSEQSGSSFLLVHG